MPFIPLPNTVMVEVRMIAQGERVENTLYFTRASAWLPIQLTAIAGEIKDWWEENVAPLISETVVLSSVYVRDMTTEFGNMTEISGDNLTGELTDGPMPNNASLAVSFRTGLVGRSFRGRNFWVGLVKPQVAGNTVGSVTEAAILAAYDALGAMADAIGVQWSIASRRANNDWRETGILTPVTSVIIVDPTIDSMRRRLPGRGT